MITFKTDFQRNGFDRPVTQHFKDQISAQLSEAGIDTLTVIIKRGPGHELVLEFEGAKQDLARARFWNTQSAHPSV